MRTQFNKNFNKVECRLSSALFLLSLFILFISGCSLDGNYDPQKDNPSVPSNPIPKNNAVGTELILTLSWQAQGIFNFDLYVDSQNPPQKLYAENLETFVYDIYGIEPGTQYFWKVVSKDENNILEGDVWTFITKPEFTKLDGTLLESKRIYISSPNDINIMFHALDSNGRGIPNYSINNFRIKEDGIDVSPIETYAELKERNRINYSLKTVLMIDNTFDEQINFEQIKNAAIAFVNNRAEEQQIAVYKFSENVELVQQFTKSIGELTSAINGIEPDGEITNLNGAAITGATQLTESYATEMIEQSALVIVTAHADNRSEFIFDEVLQAIQNKNVYTVGLGKNLDPFALSLMGNKEHFFSDDSVKLEQKLLKTQSILHNLINGFYWMVYDSPKRDNDFHTLKISVANNVLSGSKTEIEAAYLSGGFYDAEPGLYINSSSTNPAGFDTLTMFPGLTRTLTAYSFEADNIPYYTWITTDEVVVELTLTEENNKAKVKAIGNAGEQSEVILTDLNNGLQKILTIIIE
jgi:VWA domain-containing protein